MVNSATVDGRNKRPWCIVSFFCSRADGFFIGPNGLERYRYCDNDAVYATPPQHPSPQPPAPVAPGNCPCTSACVNVPVPGTTVLGLNGYRSWCTVAPTCRNPSGFYRTSSGKSVAYQFC
jgi:hypothetical protein